jgi:hypothetical protein
MLNESITVDGFINDKSQKNSCSQLIFLIVLMFGTWLAVQIQTTLSLMKCVKNQIFNDFFCWISIFLFFQYHDKRKLFCNRIHNFIPSLETYSSHMTATCNKNLFYKHFVTLNLFFFLKIYFIENYNRQINVA